MENIRGSLAKSKAGHDKDEVYVIIDADKEYVYLADGRLKTLNHLKKKNRKHIQLIMNKDTEFVSKVNMGDIMDEEIKRCIKLYNRR